MSNERAMRRVEAVLHVLGVVLIFAVFFGLAIWL